MKNTKPIVSVIMPVYNAGEFLVRAIESIRKQTVADFEFLIIDDGSTDDSWTIIKRFAKRDARIRKFRNKKNIGIVKSLNALIPKTKGRFVARMDADDISLPNRFDKQIAYLESNPQLVACGGQEHIMNERGRTIAEKYFPTEEKTCYNMIANIMVIQPPVLMARGDIFRKLRYSNHTFKNDDISMHFKLLEQGGFGNVDEVIFKYRKRETSLTHKDPKHVFFLALLVRLNAIKNYGYAPSFWNLLLLAVETMTVFILPNFAIISLFEMIRHTKRTTIRSAYDLSLAHS
jgi:glycosyltransferase involved in cell wall biosynthesis